MCRQFVIILLFFMFEIVTIKLGASQSHKLYQPRINSNQSSSTEMYSKWSTWSRCVNCYQRRMKKCLSLNCFDSRIYEERPCPKKRCRRKFRHQHKAHIIHLDATSNFLPKQANTDQYSKWSGWSSCSKDCRTHRIRYCKKPGHCRTPHEMQKAYCYHVNSNCEEFVFMLLENNQRLQQPNNVSSADKRYQYHHQTSKISHNRRCGIRPNYKKWKMLKILGGTEPEKNKWPWHVAVMNKNDEAFCGGTLIAPRWVLTASHCIRNYLRVRINAHNLLLQNGPNDVIMTVYMMFPHPQFNIRTIENDIALLLLPRESRNVVACLPNRKPRVGQLCSVMGWGKVRNTDEYGVNVLQEAKLPIVRYYTCKKSYMNTLTKNMLCAGWFSGKSDTCGGDSGGGLMCLNRKSKKASFSVQGITSFGDGCGKIKKFGIYTSVYNYINWIHFVMDHYT